MPIYKRRGYETTFGDKIALVLGMSFIVLLLVGLEFAYN